MKSNQMKALALAVLGLAGFGVAGSAMAACGNATPFAAWSSWNPGSSTNVGASLGGTTIAADGLHSTSCAMASSFTTRADQGGSFGEQAVVFDNSPAKEQTYRFRFYINPAAVAATLSTTSQVSVFGAHSASNHGATPNNQLAQMYILGDGAGNVFLRTFAACSSGDGFQGSRCLSNGGDVQLPTASFATGVRVEGQVIIGASGKVNIWVGSAVDPNTPSSTINVNNSAWGGVGVDGVKQAKLGLQTSTLAYMQNNQNKVVLFDEFDSRRQTFIGL